jgi:lipoyl(octanoyl) transferase
VAAEPRADAPGVYVGAAKIASVGLRVRRGCSYHGIALNVDLDLAPFGSINPCGYPGLEVTRLCDQGVDIGVVQAGEVLAARLGSLLGRPLNRLEPLA